MRLCFQTQSSRRTKRWSKRSVEAGEPTGAREHVCGPGVILTTSAKGAREGARVKIMPVGRPQTAGRASRSGAGLAIGRRESEILDCGADFGESADRIEAGTKRRSTRTAVEITK